MKTSVRRIALFALVQLILLSACGGGGSGNLTPGTGTTSQNTLPSGPNVVAVTVDQGPAQGGGSFNTPYVSVQICAPGSTTNCETIDHVEVDTGSFGLRILSSAITSSTLLAALPSATSATVSNMPIVECTMFADGYSWGSVRNADAHISGETASNIPIQIIGDPAFTNIPSACSSPVPNEEDTVSQFGANGIIGVGLFVQDCPDCVNSTAPGVYYACPTNGGNCTPTTVAQNQVVSNPVASFTTDNNGVILEMNAVPDAGAQQGSGVLVFGIDTQSNNMLGKATVLTTDTTFGFITIDYKGSQYPESFIDSGSNLFFLTDSSITQCSISNEQFYCPAAEQSLTAVNIGANSVQSTVNFNVANANTQFNNTAFTAFDNVAAPNPPTMNTSFDFGMPFFYGRNVFTAIEGKTTSGGQGPFFAY